MTTLSVNELQGLATKAARGAGVPPEQAARYGAAAACHLAARRDPADLRMALDSPQIATGLGTFATCLPAGPFTHTTDTPRLALSFLDALPGTVSVKATSGTLNGTHDPLTPGATALPPRLSAPGALMAFWSDLAARTYVPETEHSRLKGAGAGLTDND